MAVPGLVVAPCSVPPGAIRRRQVRPGPSGLRPSAVLVSAQDFEQLFGHAPALTTREVGAGSSTGAAACLAPGSEAAVAAAPRAFSVGFGTNSHSPQTASLSTNGQALRRTRSASSQPVRNVGMAAPAQPRSASSRRGAPPSIPSLTGPPLLTTGSSRPTLEVNAAAIKAVSSGPPAVSAENCTTNQPCGPVGMASDFFAAAVSGSAVKPSKPDTGNSPRDVGNDFHVIAWSSSSEEDGAVRHELGRESDDEKPFSYRRYRFSEAAPPAEPPASRKRCVRRNAGARKETKCLSERRPHCNDDDAVCQTPWRRDGFSRKLASRIAWPSEVLASGIANKFPTVADTRRDREDDCLAETDQLGRVASALTAFYGLPCCDLGGENLYNGCHGSVRRKPGFANVVIVAEEAWRHKNRESNLTTPPWIWVRGGRVYDFHGDRGTVDEFEHDLLHRQVEDDATVRNRRRDQGLAPWPLLPLPLKPRDEG